MNAIIALCHFCEQHGPSVLFCTQAFHCTSHSPDDVLKGVPASLTSCGFTHSRLMRGKSFANITNPLTQSVNAATAATPTRQTTCEACRSLQSDDPGLISIDRESHISYVSSQNPEEQELYSILRHACVRSLSCEVCPGREGPIIFGEEASGYVFSHTFFLKDSQSRGFQRWYSIICVMMDRIYLVNSWPFLVSNFRSIIDDLQSKTETIYKAEQAEQPQRAQRIQMSTGNSFLVTPDQFRRSRGGNQNYRSLIDLTRDKNIFQYLHQHFSWILMASGQRYTEKLLEGPPPEDYLYEPTKEGEEEGPLNETEANATGGSGPVFRSLRHMNMVIGADKMRLISFHVVRGDQLIVRGKQKGAVLSALRVLKELIPGGCCKCCPYSTHYLDSWKFNFLGLVDTAKIPMHVLASELFVLMDIDCLHEEVDWEGSPASETENSFDNYQIHIHGCPVSDCPTYLLRVLSALTDEEFTDSVFEVMLSALKEEWINKVKVLFKFSKSGSRTSEEKDRVLKILNAKPEDEILLKFWMTSLSRSYRTHLLSTSTHQPQSTTLLNEYTVEGNKG